MAEAKDIIRVNSVNDSFAQISDCDLAAALRNIIEDTIVESGKYSDAEKEQVVNKIYSKLSKIIFDSDFSHLRNDFGSFIEFVTFTTTRMM